MPDKPCIVAIGAHAADMEFSAGGALLVHARQGWDTHIINLTLGEKGAATQSVEAYAAQKKAEAKACAAILGATQHFLPYQDGELPNNDEVAVQIAVLLRQLQPQVIISHWHGSIHLDHTHTYHLARRAHFMAAIQHFRVEGLPPVSGCRMYYADNWEDPEGFEPYVFVDISDVMGDWERAFKCFAIGRGEGGYPYWDWYWARTRMHGITRRVQHAQGFAIDEMGKGRVQDLL